MNVLLTTHRLDSAAGGLPVAVVGLADALQEAGADVRLAAPATPSPIVPTRQEVRVDLIGAGEWRRYLSGVQADLVHDHGLWRPLHHEIARAASLREWPRVVAVHGMLAPTARRHHALRKRMAWQLRQRRDLASAQALHVVSDREALEVCSLGLGLPMVVIPNGVAIPPSVAASGHTKSRRMLYLGRLHPIKGVDLLVDAWIQANLEGWILDVAGPDEVGTRQALERRVEASGAHSRVQFLGPISGAEKERVLGEAELLVQPSRSESFGLAVAEALARGVPVIATDPWRLLDTKGAGWWVSPDVPALVRALRVAASSSEAERLAMGARGRAFVKQMYAWPSIAAAMLEVYKWLLGAAAPPSVRACASAVSARATW